MFFGSNLDRILSKRRMHALNWPSIETKRVQARADAPDSASATSEVLDDDGVAFLRLLTDLLSSGARAMLIIEHTDGRRDYELINVPNKSRLPSLVLQIQSLLKEAGTFRETEPPS